MEIIPGIRFIDDRHRHLLGRTIIVAEDKNSQLGPASIHSGDEMLPAEGPGQHLAETIEMTLETIDNLRIVENPEEHINLAPAWEYDHIRMPANLGDHVPIGTGETVRDQLLDQAQFNFAMADEFGWTDPGQSFRSPTPLCNMPCLKYLNRQNPSNEVWNEDGVLKNKIPCRCYDRDALPVAEICDREKEVRNLIRADTVTGHDGIIPLMDVSPENGTNIIALDPRRPVTGTPNVLPGMSDDAPIVPIEPLLTKTGAFQPVAGAKERGIVIQAIHWKMRDGMVFVSHRKKEFLRHVDRVSTASIHDLGDYGSDNVMAAPVVCGRVRDALNMWKDKRPSNDVVHCFSLESNAKIWNDQFKIVLGAPNPGELMKMIIDRRQSPQILPFNSRRFEQQSRFEKNVEQREIRARELLRNIIGDGGYKLFLRRGYVTYKGPSGKVYQLFPGHTFTRVYKDGKPFEQLCVVTKENYCPTDVLVMRLIVIMSDEDKFRSLANVHDFRPFSMRDRARKSEVDLRPLPVIFAEFKAERAMALENDPDLFIEQGTAGTIAPLSVSMAER